MSKVVDNIESLVCGLPARERLTRKLFMLTAFFDDSGTDGNGPFCVLAGYISDVERWKAFSDAWDKELRTEPKIEQFKMSQAHSKRGPFWGWDNDARERKVIRLAEIVNQHAIAGIASIVSNKAYQEEAKGCLPDTIDHPYWLCFQQIIMETLRVHGDELGGGKINFVFDSQGQGYERRGALIHAGWREIFEATPYANLLGSITFADDRDVLPLQAADLLAWHVRRRGDRAILKAPENRPADDLLGNLPIRVFDWRPSEIREFVDGYQRTHPLSPINRPDLH